MEKLPLHSFFIQKAGRVKNLVIVESPAKAKTIEGFLGKDYIVKSSFGHIRDLSKKQLGVDIANDFQPDYEIAPDKTKVIADLKKAVKTAEVVWLASDEDREGEAISWHLAETLGLDPQKTKRIVFHEITKQAITNAINSPRVIDMNLVNAQQARRVLDRLVGFEISPLLWKKVKPSLSAGRVQSVAVRLIVEREEEIRNFVSSFLYRVTGKFEVKNTAGSGVMMAELNKRFPSRSETVDFISSLKNASYFIRDVEKKPSKKSPAPPFTTSTLQQEAARKLGFSVSRTMSVAQQLYEAGMITYMRTDSVNLSESAVAAAKAEVTSLFGANYSKPRRFTTKTKGAQEAHEAIRPTYLNNSSAGIDESQRRLYDLIWKRTIASQMSDAELEKTNLFIGINVNPKTLAEEFIARGEVIKFDGFLKVYIESYDDDNAEEDEAVLPPVSINEKVYNIEVLATQKFAQQPPRYTEASLVKKLEELGIGRPSTYAPIISTIQKREYVEKGESEGIVRPYEVISLKNGIISPTQKTEKTGSDKGRLKPTDIGSLVTTYLTNNFHEIMDYNFTATVEEKFDKIAEGKMVWNKMIKEFYIPFSKTLENAHESNERVKGERELGIDPSTNKKVFVKLGRFGAIVQLGETEDTQEKPRFAGLKKGQSIETITLDEALELLKFPRKVGVSNGNEVVVSVGRFGPYVLFEKKFYSLPKGDDPLTITLERALEVVLMKQEKDRQNLIRSFDGVPGMIIQKGRFGPYLIYKETNVPLPKGIDPLTITTDECVSIGEQFLESKKGKGGKTTKKREPAAKKSLANDKKDLTEKNAADKTKKKVESKTTKNTTTTKKSSPSKTTKSKK